MPIETGQTFVIRAEKPEDLPSFELLELQWNLLRVAAICGAADIRDQDIRNQDIRNQDIRDQDEDDVDDDKYWGDD